VSGFFSSLLEKLLFKIRDIRQGLYIDSAGVCMPTEKEKNSIHHAAYRGESILLNKDKFQYITYIFMFF